MWYTIEDMQAVARQRGGSCLSSAYVNGRTKLWWRCARGHEWDAAPESVIAKTWCPVCARQRSLTLENLQREAAERGGRLISTEVGGQLDPLEWECAAGHRWWTAPFQIRHGHHWCPNCGGRAKLTIEQMHEVARSRGGLCLSKRMIGVGSPLKWQCAEGHVWKAPAQGVRREGGASGSWCPECATARKRHTIEDMQRLAASRGGECLSNVYVDTHTALRWRCARGHTWEAAPKHVLPYSKRTPGYWCAACANIAQRDTIEQMQEFARARGGECLSSVYREYRIPLRWRCSEGHEWRMRAGIVRQREARGKCWCPICEPRPHQYKRRAAGGVRIQSQ